jgi:hypothetical protein
MLTYSKSPTTESLKAISKLFGIVTGLKFITKCNRVCAIKLLGYDWESGLARSRILAEFGMEVYKACFLAFDVITMQINISFMTELSY